MIRPTTVTTVADIAGHYDELDWVYRETWGEHVHHGLWLSGFEYPGHAVVQLVDRVADLARIGPGTEVCDVGCGYGATARRLARTRRARVTGLTLSPVQHARAQARRLDGEGEFLLRDWLDNRLAPGSFHAVIAIESVEHMADKQACFREAARVLRPGGRFVFTTWLASTDLRDWERRHLLQPICAEGRLPGIGTRDEYRALLEKEGFDVHSIEDLSSEVKATWSICIRRVAAGLIRDPRYRAYVTWAANRHRAFALTLLRMWLAYETGAMRYGLFVCDTGLALE